MRGVVNVNAITKQPIAETMELYWRIVRNGTVIYEPVECQGHDFVMANCTCDECLTYNNTLRDDQ